jgi:hypothetical protein
MRKWHETGSNFERRLDEFGAKVRAFFAFIWYVGWIFVAVLVATVWLGPGDTWMDTLWYSVKYKVNIDQVHMGTKPKDCDWGHAPLGDKGCHFTATVIAYNTAGYTVPAIAWQKQLDTTGLIPLTGSNPASDQTIKSVEVRWARVMD